VFAKDGVLGDTKPQKTVQNPLVNRNIAIHNYHFKGVIE